MCYVVLGGLLTAPSGNHQPRSRHGVFWSGISKSLHECSIDCKDNISTGLNLLSKSNFRAGVLARSC
jgi:hypothetical protein